MCILEYTGKTLWNNLHSEELVYCLNFTHLESRNDFFNVLNSIKSYQHTFSKMCKPFWAGAESTIGALVGLAILLGRSLSWWNESQNHEEQQGGIENGPSLDSKSFTGNMLESQKESGFHTIAIKRLIDKYLTAIMRPLLLKNNWKLAAYHFWFCKV